LSESANILDTSIEYLKGVGPVKGELLRKELNIHTFRDLLLDFPFRYIDRTRILPIREIQKDSLVQVKGKLIDLSVIKAGKRARLEGLLRGASGKIKLVWFQRIKWIERALNLGQEYIVYGRANRYGSGFSIVHPEMEPSAGQSVALALQPVYHSTDKLNTKGLDAKGRRQLISNLLEKLSSIKIKDNLPNYLLERLQLPTRNEALYNIHFPKSEQALKAAQNRLKFEEFFFLQLQLLYKKTSRKQLIKGYDFPTVGQLFHTFYKEVLPFTLTGAQQRVIREIRNDLKSGVQMNRLLQGDVGSGKTIVALMSMLIALDNGFQACLMAPTEILAQQHFSNLSSNLQSLPIRIELLTGSVKGKRRKAILEGLQQGKIDILIGTHALLEPTVVFSNLGLAITDEQHRFGVAQRAKLWAKSKPYPPHILVMTATPIPRTLSMTLYGDLDVSIIDELPPGRKPVKTIRKSDTHRPEVMEFLRHQIHQGRQAYIVYPLIEESEKLDLKNLYDGYEQILQYFPLPKYQVSVVHGRMKPEAKESEMKRFKEGITQVMVATTVIEVGVDVPNASIMVIENAERFGLSQLHQLRGRVGRGAEQSFCILMSSYKLSREGRIRLDTMCRTNNGFEIAEVDLKLRGPGQLEGTRQSGVLSFKIANIVQDTQILQSARKIVTQILGKDPGLAHPANSVLKKYIEGQKRKSNWSLIS